MRDIIFRGKRLDNGEWLYGDLMQCGFHVHICDHDKTPDPDFDFSQSEVNPDTVGQYTGHTDRVGNKIFEGDLLEYCSGVDSFGAVWQTVRVEYRAIEGGYVGINEYRNTRDGRELVSNILRCLNKCIVRGNIHDKEGGEQ